MSEPIPEAGGGGNFLTRRFGGIPAWVILAGIAVLAYFYFSRSSKGSTQGASSTGGGGTSTTGDISIAPATTNINVKGQYGPNTQSVTTKSPPPRHRTHNPQPRPKVKPTRKRQMTTILTPPKSWKSI